MRDIEDARAIIYHLDAERVARMAWRAAYADGKYRDSVVMLHLESGHVYAVAPVSPDDQVLPGEVVVGWLSAERRRKSESVFAVAREDVPPSVDVVEEAVMRHARRRWLTTEHWRMIEMQLERIYERTAAA